MAFYKNFLFNFDLAIKKVHVNIFQYLLWDWKESILKGGIECQACSQTFKKGGAIFTGQGCDSTLHLIRNTNLTYYLYLTYIPHTTVQDNHLRSQAKVCTTFAYLGVNKLFQESDHFGEMGHYRSGGGWESTWHTPLGYRHVRVHE